MNEGRYETVWAMRRKLLELECEYMGVYCTNLSFVYKWQKPVKKHIK